MTVETIQSTIDTKADRSLNGDITAVFAKFRKDLGIQNHQTFKVITTDKVFAKLNIYKTLDALHKTIFENKKEFHRNKATEEFMAKINGIGEDVEKLKQPAEQ